MMYIGSTRTVFSAALLALCCGASVRFIQLETRTILRVPSSSSSSSSSWGSSNSTATTETIAAADDGDEARPRLVERATHSQREVDALVEYLRRSTTTTTSKKEKGNRNHNNDNNSKNAPQSSSSSSSSSSKYAYAFVLGGVDPDIPKYRMYLYGVYVAVYNLKVKFRSEADVVLLVEMYDKSPHDRLPDREARILRRLGVTQLLYVPQAPSPSFYRIQLNKFRVFGLYGRYKRVLYMDADVMPMTNMDYLFRASDPNPSEAAPAPATTTSSNRVVGSYREPILAENVIVLGKYAPANGGTFMITPREGDLERINDLIQAMERRLNAKEFDRNGMGWGHRLGLWTGLEHGARGWNFMAADADQGLLYYWVKYVQKNVTVLGRGGVLETWGPTPLVNNKSAAPLDPIAFAKSNVPLSNEGDVERKRLVTLQQQRQQRLP